MTTTALLDKDLNVIYRSAWVDKREKDEKYWLLHHWEERGIRVSAEWSGKIEGANRTHRSKWKPWALEVIITEKVDEYGDPLKNVVVTRDGLSCETFLTLEDLNRAYNEFLDANYKKTPVVLNSGTAEPEPEPEEEEDDDDDHEIGGGWPAPEITAKEAVVEPTPPEGSDKVSGGLAAGDW